MTVENEIFETVRDYQLQFGIPYTREVPPELLENDLGINFTVHTYSNDLGDYGFRLIANYNGQKKIINYGYDSESARDWHITVDNI